MSCFVVSDPTLQRAVTALLVAEGGHANPWRADVLGRELLRLNALAVRAWYADAPAIVAAADAALARAPAFRWDRRDFGAAAGPNPEALVAEVSSRPALCRVLKALECLRYQVGGAAADAPADDPDARLRRRIDAAISRLQGRIVATLAAYRAAPWG